LKGHLDSYVTLNSFSSILEQMHEINTSHVGYVWRKFVVAASNGEVESVTLESDATHLVITDCLMNIREASFIAIDIGEHGAHKK
jgi:hypothetical protein